MKSATDRPQDAQTDVIDTLRRFHYGEPAATQATQRPQGAILTALLNPYRDASAIRYQYPLYLAPVEGSADAALAVPLTEHLAGGVESLALRPDSAPALREHHPSLERYLRQQRTRTDRIEPPALVDHAASARLEPIGQN